MNKKGFSLVEIIVTMGLMGVAAMFMMKLRTSQSKSLKTTENQAFILSTFNEIRAYLQKPNVCKLSFGQNQIKQGLELSAILRQDGTLKYKVSQKLSGGSYIISKIWLENVLSSPVDEEKTEFRGEAILNIKFTKTNEESFGGSSIIKNVELDFLTDKDSKVIDCAPLGYLAVPTASVPSSSNSDATSAINKAVAATNETTGKGLTQEQINKVVKDNKELSEMMQMIKNVEEANKRAAKLLEEE